MDPMPTPPDPIEQRPTMPAQDPADADRQPQTAPIDPGMPILVQPVPSPKWPPVITTVRNLTGIQVVLVMIFGNCSFGIPLLGAIIWTSVRFDWNDVAGFGIPLAWTIGFAAILIYAYFTNRWAARADRRARTTIIIGTAVLICFTAAAIPLFGWGAVAVVILAAAPSLTIQAIVLRCVYGREGRRWFDGSEAARMDGSA
jgi:hypothetical protein